MAQPPANKLLALRLEIKSVQLSVAKSVTSPAAIVIFCNSPKFKSKRLTAEYKMCILVFRLSQPKLLLRISEKTKSPIAKTTVKIVNAAAILAKASRLRP